MTPKLHFCRRWAFGAGRCLAGLLFVAGLKAAPLGETVVFASTTEGYDTMRIPAIVRAPNGDLLAFAEGRKNSRSDTGNIDLLLKRSHDGGITWGAIQVLWDDGENTCGNPCAVVDAHTGVVWLFSTHNLGRDSEAAILGNAGAGGRTVWILHSNDSGATWTKPENISQSTRRPEWTWYATGPGVGIQLQQGPHAGRMVIPCDHNERVGTAKSEHASHAIYSDDDGATWKIGGSIQPDMNECQVVELFGTPGTLLMDMRSYRGLAQRAESRSTDGGATWSAAVDVPALVDPVCQGSILRWENGGNPRAGWILFSNAADPKKRRNLTVRASADDARTWSRTLVLHPGPAAYSCLVALDREHAGCLFEISDRRPSEAIVFVRFTAEDFNSH